MNKPFLFIICILILAHSCIRQRESTDDKSLSATNIGKPDALSNVPNSQTKDNGQHQLDNVAGAEKNYPPLTKENLEIYEYSIESDTLKILSLSDFLYYPFGNFYKKKDFFDYTKTIGAGAFTSGKYEDTGTPFHRFGYKASYLRFLEGEEGRLEIVGARILDTEILLRNGVRTGLGFDEVMESFTDSIGQSEISNVKVIELISALTGVWQYYQFNDGVLFSIYIDTDYYVAKD